MGIADSDKKVGRLVEVARMYYEQDRTQGEIAAYYGISRPMVSKLLKEARDTGIVTIRIQAPQIRETRQISLMEQVGRKFGIYGGMVIPDGSGDHATNAAVAEAAISFLEGLGEDNLGIGWGHIIGDVVKCMEQKERLVPVCTSVCPLIGNGGVGLKNYHSNELVRAIAEHSGARPDFIYSPASVLSEQELRLMKSLDNYHEVYRSWEKLDIALVNIGNFPSTPDFASEARYGDRLTRQKAVGRILNYYIDVEGHVIRSETDYAIQIPLELLAKTRYAVGICSANTSPKALRGALKSGYINHILAPEHVIREMLEQ